MRFPFTALALILAACTPAPPASQGSAEQPAAQQPGAANAYATALAGAPQPGAWVFRGDDGTISTCFGAADSECQVFIVCQSPTGELSFTVARELAPDQPTTLRVVTTAQMLDLPARSRNAGLPQVSAELADAAPEKLPLIGMLGAPAERFAVEIAGEIAVYPWDESIARTLIACR